METRGESFPEIALGDDPRLAPLTSLLIARTAGNPFFLEESVRTLVETGGLVGETSAYCLAQPLHSIQVPATVQAVLAARIDRLPSEAKRLLQTAAVIGTEVPFPLLAAIADLPDTELHRHLTHLQAAEFLYETRLFPELEYTFKHALTHEVAYGSLLQERRRALHARIVETLEALAGDRVPEQVERLAHHAWRGGVWEKALMYFRQAGQKAMTRSAHSEAVTYLEQALSALPHMPDQHETHEQAIDLRLELRSALAPLDDFGRILTTLREAEALAEALNDQRRLRQIFVALSLQFYRMGAHDQAIASGQRALALTTTDDNVDLHAVANQYLGFAYWAKGDYHRAVHCLGQSIASLEGAMRHERCGQVFLPSVLSRALLTACHAEQGMFPEGATLGEEGLCIAEAAGHPASLMWAYYAMGLLTLRQGELHRTRPLLERALSVCQEANLPMYVPWTAAALGAAYTLAGRVADAVPLLTRALAQATATGRVGFQVLCSLSLGEAQVLAGRPEEAHALAEQAQALARAHRERGHEAYALRLFGEIAVHRNSPESTLAEAAYRQALALADELGMRPLVAHCYLSLGTLSVKTGQREQARTELSTAIEMYRDMGMTFWLPQTEAALAQVEGR